jgi:hypothetical protein
MAITVEERYDSPSITEGADPAAELSFLIHGTADEALALQELQMQAPEATRVCLGVTFAFDTGGGTQHITQSRSTINGYAPSGETAPDFQGAIGVTDNGVEGVDVTVPVYHFSETHYLDDAVVTPAYKGTLFALTGQVNSGSFKGLAAGECLFLGAAGSKRGLGDWEITFRFAGSPNVTGLAVGPISGISKKGWEYLWVRYESDVDDTANRLIQKPSSVHIEQVYRSGNLMLLGIGGGGGLGEVCSGRRSLQARPGRRTAAGQRDRLQRHARCGACPSPVAARRWRGALTAARLGPGRGARAGTTPA